jgi:hypothetical protein
MGNLGNEDRNKNVCYASGERYCLLVDDFSGLPLVLS